MAKLDEAAYEIIRLFPAGTRSRINVDFVRGQIKNSAAQLSADRDEQAKILRELRDDLIAFPESDRDRVLENYFTLKAEKLRLDQAVKARARQNLLFLGSAVLCGVALLTFITMILVLLSIERNTRGGTLQAG